MEEGRFVRGAGRILGASSLGANLLAVDVADDKLFSTRMPANTELHMQHTMQM